MNKLLIIATMLVFPTVAQAIPAHKITYCEVVGDAARVTMKARQNGKSMQETMRMANDIGQEGERNIVVAMVEMAYKTDVRYSEEMKQREISEFANMWYAQCFEIIK